MLPVFQPIRFNERNGKVIHCRSPVNTPALPLPSASQLPVGAQLLTLRPGTKGAAPLPAGRRVSSRPPTILFEGHVTLLFMEHLDLEHITSTLASCKNSKHVPHARTLSVLGVVDEANITCL